MKHTETQHDCIQRTQDHQWKSRQVEQLFLPVTFGMGPNHPTQHAYIYIQGTKTRPDQRKEHMITSVDTTVHLYASVFTKTEDKWYSKTKCNSDEGRDATVHFSPSKKVHTYKMLRMTMWFLFLSDLKPTRHDFIKRIFFGKKLENKCQVSKYQNGSKLNFRIYRNAMTQDNYINQVLVVENQASISSDQFNLKQ